MPQAGISLCIAHENRSVNSGNHITILIPFGMNFDFLRPYEPVNTLKKVDENLWIADGAVIYMKFGFIGLPFTTRMTVVRLSDGGLWVHSPIEPTEQLLTDLAELGPVSYIVAPNKIHYWWSPAWKKLFPGAVLSGVKGTQRRATRFGVNVPFDRLITDEPYPAWERDFNQIVVHGGYMDEAVFYHKASETLILTDLIENFEPQKVKNSAARFLLRLSGVCDPCGSMPKDMRMTFKGERRYMLRDAVRTMMAWNPRRIILAHGRCYGTDAVEELRRAFSWVLAD